jgi:hypothetical protein
MSAPEFLSLLALDAFLGLVVWVIAMVGLFAAVAWMGRDLEIADPDPRALRLCRHFFLILAEPLEGLRRIRFHFAGIRRDFLR